MEPLTYNPQEPQYPQTLNWTCSASSLAWLNRALGIMVATEELAAADYIGHPENINEVYGLMDGSGSRLRDCLREQGAPAFCSWPAWDDLYVMAEHWPCLIGGQQWYHWVGVRGVSGDHLLLANSAPGWMGIDQELTEDHFYQLGPFACVAVPLLTPFPPPPSA